MSVSSRASHGQCAPIKWPQRIASNSRIALMFAGVSDANVSRETFRTKKRRLQDARCSSTHRACMSASHMQCAMFKWRKEFGQASEKPLRLLGIQTRTFHVKRPLVQENKTRMRSNQLPFDGASTPDLTL